MSFYLAFWCGSSARTPHQQPQLKSSRRLARLVSLKDHEFDAEEISHDYEQSALLVRYLLVDPQLAAGFRSFLAELAEGENYSPELLEQHLKLEWSELDKKLETCLAPL